MNLTINAQKVAAVAEFRAIKDRREYLNGVWVGPHHAGGAIIVATDGRALAAMHDPAGECPAAVIVNASVPLLAACKKRGAEHVAIRDGGLIVAKGAAEGLCASFVQPGAPTIDAQYPEWQRVVPAEGVNSCPAYVDAAYMARFATVARILGVKYAAMRVYGTADGQGGVDADRPVIVRLAHAPEFVAVIMPMSATGFAHALPEWFTAPADAAELPADDEEIAA